MDVHKGEGSGSCGQGEGVKNLIFVDDINGWPHKLVPAALLLWALYKSYDYCTQ